MVDVGMPWVGVPPTAQCGDTDLCLPHAGLNTQHLKKTFFKEFLTLKFNFGNASFHCHKSWSQTICPFLDCWLPQKIEMQMILESPRSQCTIQIQD